MAIAKIILNGVTQIDVTQKTVTSASMLSGTTALKNDGTDISGSIATKTSSDLTASGATVTVPAGYYASNASKSVSSGSATTPATSITANPTISVNSTTGLITASVSGSKSVTPTVSAGYVSSGTSGTISVSGSNTSQLSTQSGTTITPTESEQTAVSAGKYTLGAVKVGAISSTYIGSGIDQRDDTDLTVSGATVTVPSGYYADTETKSIASGSATTPETSITATPSLSVNSSTGVVSAVVLTSQNVTPTVVAGYVSTGTAGEITVSGAKTAQLSSQAAQTIYPSSSDQTISSGKYLTGTQTIKAVTTTNLSASNVKDGTVVEVGDSSDSDRITSVTGTFTDASTVSSGQTAATAGEILTGYSAWVDGSEVQGSLRAMTTQEISAAVSAGWSS